MTDTKYKVIVSDKAETNARNAHPFYCTGQ